MFSKNIALSSLTAIAMLGIIGCAGQSDRDKLAEAQFCLDKSTTGTAASCLEKISGIDTPEAHGLICAAGFIDAGVVSPENLSQAINAISDSQGNDGSVVMLASLSFGVGKKAEADSANSSCAKSGSAGFALLGAMAKAATSLTNIGGLSLGSCTNGSCDFDQIQGEIESNLEEIVKVLENDPTATMDEEEAVEAAVEIAGSIVDVYEATCGTTVINKDICGEIEKAAVDANINIVQDILSLPPSARDAKLEELAKSLLGTWKPTP